MKKIDNVLYAQQMAAETSVIYEQTNAMTRSYTLPWKTCFIFNNKRMRAWGSSLQ